MAFLNNPEEYKKGQQDVKKGKKMITLSKNLNAPPFPSILLFTIIACEIQVSEYACVCVCVYESCIDVCVHTHSTSAEGRAQVG